MFISGVIGCFESLKLPDSHFPATKPGAMAPWSVFRPISVESMKYALGLYRFTYFGIRPIKIGITVKADSVYLFNVIEFFMPI